MIAELTPEQKDLFDYHCKLFNYRKYSQILQRGRTKHFLGRDNTYAFFRYTQDGAIFVFANASEEERTIPTSHYNEMLLQYDTTGIDIMTGERVNLSRKDIKVKPLSTLIVRLGQ